MARPPKPPDDGDTLFDLPLNRPEPPPEILPTDDEEPSEPGQAEPFVPVTPEPGPVAPPIVLPAEESLDADEPLLDDDLFADEPDPPPQPTLAVEDITEVEAAPPPEAPQLSFALTSPEVGDLPATPDEAPPAKTAAARPAPFAARLLAGLADIGLVFAGLVVAVLGAAALGSPPGLEAWPAILALGLAFSFVYTVVPLAFWGRTAGMAVLHLSACCADRRPLTFRQASLRWVAGLVHVATAGLTLLVGLTGRSLEDRLSGSETVQVPV